jgi:hypothetical protein
MGYCLDAYWKVCVCLCRSKSKQAFILYSVDVGGVFRNYYCIDMLLRIVEEFPDELKILASSALNILCRDKEVQALFKQFNACEKLLK